MTKTYAVPIVVRFTLSGIEPLSRNLSGRVEKQFKESRDFTVIPVTEVSLRHAFQSEDVVPTQYIVRQQKE
jgi:hypothetical protein